MPKSIPDSGRYSLKVRGDNMTEIGIMDGDYVVIEPLKKGAIPTDGSIVVALVNNEAAQLARIYVTDRGVELRREDRAQTVTRHRPSEIQVQGVMVGLFRSY